MTPTTLSRVGAAQAYGVLPAENLARARAFYGDTLGFEIQEMETSGSFLVAAGGGTRFLVYERARTTAEHTALTLLVDDLDSVVSDLRSRGVRFEDYDIPGLKTVEGIASMDGGGRSAWFTDPEGNIIAVTQM